MRSSFPQRHLLVHNLEIDGEQPRSLLTTIPTAKSPSIILGVLFALTGEPGLKGKEDVLAEAGSRVDLTCSYPCKYYSYEKYWCKWSSDGCSPLSASDQSQPGVDVSCDTANKTLVLTFDLVTTADQGWYWCGVKRNGHYGETLAVYLQVAGGEPQGKGRWGSAASLGVNHAAFC